MKSIKKNYIRYTEMYNKKKERKKSVDFMLPLSIHFEISIPLDAYNFGT